MEILIIQGRGAAYGGSLVAPYKASQDYLLAMLPQINKPIAAIMYSQLISDLCRPYCVIKACEMFDMVCPLPSLKEFPQQSI